MELGILFDEMQVRRAAHARVLILLGAPGSGKGTQGAFLRRELGIPSISTGEILRSEASSGSALGERLRKLLAGGELVHDEIVNRVVAKRLAEPDCVDGFLLDGYPRSVAQAEFLTWLLLESGFPEPAVLHLDVAPEAIVNRLAGRRQCPVCGRIYNVSFQPPRVDGVCDDDGAALVQRADDRDEVIHERLAVYEKATKPIVDYYRAGDYHRVDASGSEAAVREEIEQALALVPVAR